MAKETDGFAIASLIMGILFFIPFASVLAIVFGIVGLNNIKNNPKLDGKGMALAGIILGAIFLVLMLIVFIMMVFFMAAFFIPFRMIY